MKQFNRQLPSQRQKKAIKNPFDLTASSRFHKYFLYSLDSIFLNFIFIFKVRELSPNEAVAALMARLSYSASLRAEIASRRCAEKLSALETFKVAATFSLLVFQTRFIFKGYHFQS